MKKVNEQKCQIQYDSLFLENYYPIVAFINSYINNREDALDIAQETFIKLWNNKDSINIDQPLKPYLFTISKNLALNYLKHQKVKLNFQNNQLEEYRIIENELNSYALMNFSEEEFEKSIKRKKIRVNIMKLPFSDRKIFILNKFNNLTYEEIAELLSISPKTVEKRVKISINLIKQKILIIF